MATALTALATTTLASASATVTFSSISGSYRDLRLIVAGAGTGGSSLCMKFNSDAGSNYHFVRMLGDGSTAASSTGSPRAFAYCGDFGSAQSNAVIDIMDYTATDKHKTVLSRSNVPANYVFAVASRWANTAAITSIDVYIDSTTIAAGSVLSLYGVSA